MNYRVSSVFSYDQLSTNEIMTFDIIRPHRSTTWPILTDRVAWSVGLSVCHTSEPCKNACTDRAAVWVEDLGGPGNDVLYLSLIHI